MTFTEAAVEVLRLVGKPLHYKKITEVAIERNLLSHVGKTPEVTMSSRLATMVKRDRGEAPIIKVKPGVFGLREFNEEQLADLSGDVDELPEVEVENEQDKTLETGESTVELPSVLPSIEPRRPLPGADVFPEEEDDDEPILGGDDEEDDDEEGEGEEGARTEGQPAGESRSSRRRRKRRRRGGGDEPAEEQRAPAREQPRNERRFERPERPERNERRERRDRDRERDRERERDDRREQPIDFSREPGDGDLLGKDLADAVASVLSQSGPRGASAVRIAEQLVRRGRLSGDAEVLVPTVMAAVRADVARHRVQHTRPRFRIEGTYVTCTEFLLPQDVVRAEQEVTRAAERQRERARRAFLRKLSELPGAGLAELIATWLNTEGVIGLRAVRKPGSGVGELHLAGTLRRGAEEVRLAVVVYRDNRELGRERVIEARGSLHYYGNASTAWLITFGNVMTGAREEAGAPASDPVALFDGIALATAMETRGVGLIVQSVPISVIDYELFDSLRGQAPREREYRERERPRLVLERPRPAEEEEVDAVEEAAEDGALDEGDEVVDAVLQEAVEPSAEGQGEARESNRRRRRRRRRRGRGNEGAAEPALAGEAAEEAEAGDVGEEWTAAAESYEEERGEEERVGHGSPDDEERDEDERERDEDDDEERSFEEAESSPTDEDADDADETEDDEDDAERDDEERERDDDDDFDGRRGHG
jgi:hypothetical protein